MHGRKVDSVMADELSWFQKSQLLAAVFVSLLNQILTKFDMTNDREDRTNKYLMVAWKLRGLKHNPMATGICRLKLHQWFGSLESHQGPVCFGKNLLLGNSAFRHGKPASGVGVGYSLRFKYQLGHPKGMRILRIRTHQLSPVSGR